ncbi:MAG: ABC transporter ATP-binding protein [Candidatus Spechtbacterales bacterium]|nr:ABC transporter ATP-binding protein [Candidatus Spechtbacterales bacterium]
MALIEVRDLEKIYKTGEVETRALRGVSFDIEKGEFVAVMGPSGSGKSTLLHMLGFLDTHTSGTYKFDGKKFTEYSEDERAHLRNKKMGFVFQTFNLLPRLSTIENVKLPLMYSDVPEKEWNERAKAALEAVEMGHRLDHLAFKLSGGEKQRVAMARALVNEPEVIFADEPTGNLDSKSGEAVMSVLQSLNEDMGHTVILITHETYTAQYSERILELFDGELAKDFKVKNRNSIKDGHFKK